MTDKPRVLATGEGRVLVGFTVREIREILECTVNPEIRARLITAIALLDAEAAKEYVDRFKE